MLTGHLPTTLLRSHLEAGLSQLRQTNSHVDKLQMELHCLHPEVEAKTKVSGSYSQVQTQNCPLGTHLVTLHATTCSQAELTVLAVGVF